MKNEQPTLIVLTPGFPKDESDSTCLPTVQLLIKNLNRQFPRLRIIILAFDYPFLNENYSWYGNTVIPFNSWKKKRVKKMFILLSLWQTLKRLRKTNNVTGILSFWCGICALIGHRFGKKHGIQHYCWIRGQDAKKENRYVRKIKPQPGELIAISDFIQNEFEKNHGIRPAHVLPNGIDPIVSPKENIERGIDVMAAGSLIPLKQYEIFVEIVSRLKEHFPEIRAVLSGKGPGENKLRELIDDYQLQDNLNIKGEMPHPQVLDEMRRCKLFLHTSSYEGFSMVCAEALNAGATVISFCKPMNDDIPNWHIVDTKEAMLQNAIDVLNQPLPLKVGFPFSLNEISKKLMALFHYSE